MKNKICLVALYPAHYRELIYKLMDDQLNCEFIFGYKDSSIKCLRADTLKHSVLVPNMPIGKGRLYKMPKVMHYIKQYEVIINDMGILCITSWVLLFYSIIAKKKVYLWDHGWYGRENNIKKIIKRIYFGLASGAMVYGNYARNLMIDNGFNASKLVVIHNSLNYDKQLIIRDQLRPSLVYQKYFNNSYPVLIVIGRLTYIKRLELLIEAVTLLNQRGEFYNIVFIGEGEAKKRLETLAFKKRLGDRIWFYGECYDEIINADLIYNADICVIPGSVGLSAIHSMMFGTPCITHNYYSYQGPEFESIIEGVTGSYFQYDSIENLAQCISQWYENHIGEREKIRLSCYREIDDKWNPNKQIAIMKNFILT